MADGRGEGLRERLTRQGEDALGKLAQDLLENPLINGAITRAFEARERAVQAQEAAMGALNIPSAADIERLTRRLRQVGQRLEGIEDGVDRLDQRLEALARGTEPGLSDRLAAVEAQVGKLAAEVSQLGAALDAAPAPVPREQERLAVDEAAARPPAAPAAKPAGGATTPRAAAGGGRVGARAAKPAGGAAAARGARPSGARSARAKKS